MQWQLLMPQYMYSVLMELVIDSLLTWQSMHEVSSDNTKGLVDCMHTTNIQISLERIVNMERNQIMNHVDGFDVFHSHSSYVYD